MAENTKAKLIALLKTALDEQRAFVAGLSDAERTQAGTATKWSAKDTLAHIAFWQTHQVQVYKALARGEKPADVADDDVQNQIVFNERCDQPWPVVIASAEEAYEALRILVESYTEAGLTTPNQFPPPYERPLWRYFLGNGYTHPVLHYADFYIDHGDLARATARNKQIAKETADFGDDEWRGIADYNLACFYAKTGQKAQAFELLPAALKLAPDLVEWSKEDPDLLPLHGESEYEALYR